MTALLQIESVRYSKYSNGQQADVSFFLHRLHSHRFCMAVECRLRCNQFRWGNFPLNASDRNVSIIVVSLSLLPASFHFIALDVIEDRHGEIQTDSNHSCEIPPFQAYFMQFNYARCLETLMHSFLS